MAKEVYAAAVALTEVDLTGHVFDLLGGACRKALDDSSVRSFDLERLVPPIRRRASAASEPMTPI